MIVSRLELAEILDIPPAKVSTLQNNGVFTPVSRGNYDLKESIQKFIEISVEHLIKKKLPKTTGTPQENLQFWKMIRVKNAAMRELGVTMRAEDAEKLMSTRLEQIRNVLNSIDSVWAPYMVGIKTVEDSQRILAKQLDILFEQLSSLQDFDVEVEIPSNEEMEAIVDDESLDPFNGEDEDVNEE